MNLREYYKYGYYTGGPFNRPTRSKVEAIEWCSPHQSWPTWNFHDDDFSNHDWTHPPTETFEQLYQARARQLREKYDYVIVQYSGGVDSHNMLMSFLSQGIIPDEVQFFYYKFCEDKNILGVEWRLQTQPKLAKLQHQYPDLKIRKIDLTDYAVDFIQTVDGDEIYQFKGRYPIRINPSIRCRLTSLVPDYRVLKDQGKSIRILLGMDKPRLRYHNKRFIFNFYDVIHDENIETAETNDHEWFYWHPDAAKILIKQAHVVKKFWSLHQPDWAKMHCHYDAALGWILNHNNDHVYRLIYPWHNNDLYLPASVKAWQGSIGPRDIELLTSNFDAATKYIKSTSAILHSIDPMYFNNQDPDQGLISSISRDYLLD